MREPSHTAIGTWSGGRYLHFGEAIEAASTGWARVPWTAVGAAGEAEANTQSVTVRCLVREDGSVPDSEDEPGLVAILARSY